MLEKIKICLCHPKYIAMYYKEKASKIAILILTFFLAFAGVVILSESNRDYFTKIDNNEIVQSIIEGEVPTVSFDPNTNVFTGDQATYKSQYYNIYFLPTGDTNFKTTEEKTTIVFESDKVKVYYTNLLLYEGNYDNDKLEEFDLSLVNQGDINNIISFNKLLTIVLNDANGMFNAYAIVNYISTMILHYFGIVGMLFIFSLFSNPTIGKGVRFKLCCLDSLIFILVFAFQLMFKIEWLIYVALTLPVIYSNVTFMHIVRKVN